LSFHRVHVLRRPMFLLLIAALMSTLVTTARPASAAPARIARAARAAVTVTASATASARAIAPARLRSYRILAIARAQKGKPYRFGAAGPRAFDCSGLAGYAYRAVNLKLPRTADQQYRYARAVARSAARPGDLVFWVSGGRAYHVGVYAGGGKVWHAPKAGDRVRLATIWSWSRVRFGRVGA